MPIRPATEADLPKVCALIAGSVQKNASEDGPTDLAFVVSKYDLARLLECLHDHEMFCFEQDSQLKGVVILAGDRLHSLYVAIDAMGRGIGRQLLTHIENLARERGVKTIFVSSSRTGVPFYERLGYAKLNFEPRKLAPTWAMAKILTAAS